MKKPLTAEDHGFGALLSEVGTEVSRRLRVVLAEQQRLANSRGPEVRSMASAVSTLTLRGGKRLRAVLCMLGGLSVSARAPRRPLLEAGVALELLQTYFLIHDDWMDGDALRRGGPTAHVALEARFGSTHTGERAAILAGDHAVALAQLELSKVSVSAERKVRAMRTFAEMQVDAVAGQQRDLIGRAAGVELTYQLKTASYTVIGPLTLGAQLAGARAPTLAALEAFGRPAGIAFQLRDDLLGAFGDPSITGKPRGADLLAGKSTPLLRQGRRLLPASSRKRLERIVGRRRASQAEVEAALAELERSGARAVIERRIERLRAEATKHLDRGSITSGGSELLRGALDRLLERHA